MLQARTPVKVLAHRIPGHCRTPLYLRGRTGIVLALAGSYRDPERLAYHKPGLPPRRLYRVRFRMQDLWERYDGGPDDTLEADLYEHWLEAIDEEQPT